MPVVVPEGYGQVTWVWQNTQSAKELSVTLGFKDLAVSPLTPDALAADLHTRFSTGTDRPASPSAMAVGWLFTRTHITVTRSGLPRPGDKVLTVTGTLSATGQNNPVFNPLVVSKRTGIGGQRYRGRMYPPLTYGDETGVDATGQLATGTRNAAQTNWTSLHVSMISSDYPPYLLHSVSEIAPTAISSFLVRPVVGVQRRRRARGA